MEVAIDGGWRLEFCIIDDEPIGEREAQEGIDKTFVKAFINGVVSWVSSIMHLRVVVGWFGDNSWILTSKHRLLQAFTVGLFMRGI